MKSWRENNLLNRFKESNSQEMINKITTIIDYLSGLYGYPGFYGKGKGDKDISFSTGSLDTYANVWCIVTPDVDLSRKVDKHSSSVDIAEEIVNLVVNRHEYCYITLWAPTVDSMEDYVDGDEEFVEDIDDSENYMTDYHTDRMDAIFSLAKEKRFPKVFMDKIEEFNSLCGDSSKYSKDRINGSSYILLDLSYDESIDDSYNFVVNHLDDYNDLIYKEFGKVVGLSRDWGIDPYPVEELLD